MNKLNDLYKIHSLYENWDESMIWSCFQGMMGEAYVDDVYSPQSAIVYVNCFAFAAGKPDKNLVRSWYDEKVDKFAIITAQDESWNRIFEQTGIDRSRCVERYAIKKEKDIFDVEKLHMIVDNLNPDYELKLIDEHIYNLCKKNDWSVDFVQGYETYEKYKKYGLGVAAFYNGELVAGASSYSSYIGGIEVEIDTKEEFRRKGLATVCGAKLILECTKRGLYPSWDAQNKWSVALAEKLGYHFSDAYTAYEVWK